jgi:hypothetical protein
VQNTPGTTGRVCQRTQLIFASFGHSYVEPGGEVSACRFEVCARLVHDRFTSPRTRATRRCMDGVSFRRPLRQQPNRRRGSSSPAQRMFPQRRGLRGNVVLLSIRSPSETARRRHRKKRIYFLQSRIDRGRRVGIGPLEYQHSLRLHQKKLAGFPPLEA